MEGWRPGGEGAGAGRSGAGGLAPADAIRTTDTVVKIAFRKVEHPAGAVTATSTASYTVGGMAKGAGMLAPALATMLCVLTTDAEFDASELDRALRHAVAPTFDRVDTA